LFMNYNGYSKMLEAQRSVDKHDIIDNAEWNDQEKRKEIYKLVLPSTSNHWSKRKYWLTRFQLI
jgi:hypothetical protein